MSVCPMQYVCELYNILVQWSSILAENEHFNKLLWHHLSTIITLIKKTLLQTLHSVVQIIIDRWCCNSLLKCLFLASIELHWTKILYSSQTYYIGHTDIVLGHLTQTIRYASWEVKIWAQYLENTMLVLYWAALIYMHVISPSFCSSSTKLQEYAWLLSWRGNYSVDKPRCNMLDKYVM